MYAIYAKLRDEHQTNDLKVAHATGIPPSTLYDWGQREKERAGAKIGVDKLAKIAAHFNVTVDYFLK